MWCVLISPCSDDISSLSGGILKIGGSKCQLGELFDSWQMSPVTQLPFDYCNSDYVTLYLIFDISAVLISLKENQAKLPDSKRIKGRFVAS